MKSTTSSNAIRVIARPDEGRPTKSTTIYDTTVEEVIALVEHAAKLAESGELPGWPIKSSLDVSPVPSVASETVPHESE